MPRGKLRDRAQAAIPILDAGRRIVGWTESNPEIVGATLRHAEAEKLVGGPIAAVYVQLEDIALARRAGAPEDWARPWRCLALCKEGTVAGSSGQVTVTEPLVRGAADG